MLFPTFEFGIFFLFVFAAAWELRRDANWRKLFLVGASYFFYGWWDWRFVGLLILSSAINFTAGWLLDRAKRPSARKAIVMGAVALNLAILGFFKYYGFFLESFAVVLETMGLERDLPFMQIILPVGISFFTFQGISYVVDVYRGHVRASHSVLDVFLYISFFPQLVAGPIVRAAAFLPQLDEVPRLTRQMAAIGIVLVLSGLAKKMVIANYLAVELVDPVFFDPSAAGALDLLIGVYGYAVQIYCDFSGYSDIAIGVAALLGYRFAENFNQPYRAASLQEFWRRWHISLSTWLRDYLYIPLGGSRNGTRATYRNLFLTMFLGGIWHGAAWTFVFWGAFHGAMLGLERYARARLNAFAPPEGEPPRYISRLSKPVTHLLAVAVTFHVVCFAWIFFRSESFSMAGVYLAGFFDWSAPSQYVTPFILAMIAGAMLFQFTPPRLAEWLAKPLEYAPSAVLGLVLGLGIFAIWAAAPPGVAPFIYFQF